VAVAKVVRIEDIARERPIIVELATRINRAKAEHGIFSKEVSSLSIQIRQLKPPISFEEWQEVCRFISSLEDNWPPEVKKIRRSELDVISQISDIGG
jgi:hypothetical protein